MLVRPLMTNLKMTVRNVLCCFCMWPPKPQMLASEIKQTFLSINLACLLAFERRAAGSHTLLVTRPELLWFPKGHPASEGRVGENTAIPAQTFSTLSNRNMINLYGLRASVLDRSILLLWDEGVGRGHGVGARTIGSCSVSVWAVNPGDQTQLQDPSLFSKSGDGDFWPSS